MSRLSRLGLVAVSFIALSAALPAPAHAQSVPATQTHEQALQTVPGKFIQDLGDRAIAIIRDKAMPKPQRDAQFSQILGQSFDLRTIGRFVIGRAWNTATPEQQEQYMSLFKQLVIKNYGDRMSLYTGEGFSVVGTRPESDMDTTVNSQITHPDGSQPTSVDWRVRQKDGKIGVIDVVVEGVSLSVTQRGEYSAVIQQNGGNIQGLINQMQAELNGNATTSTVAPMPATR